MVRWHCQHQRIQGELAEVALAQSQAAQMAVMTGMLQPPQRQDEDGENG